MPFFLNIQILFHTRIEVLSTHYVLRTQYWRHNFGYERIGDRNISQLQEFMRKGSK